MNPFTILSIGGGMLLLPFLLPPSTTPPLRGGRYVGDAVCKMCHNGDAKGNQYTIWSKTQHAKAYETLATPKAKEYAKKDGIADPQKSDKCLKCHVTGYGKPAADFMPTFKMEDGVQCETCHGPGEDHRKKRLMIRPGEAPPPVGADEIHSKRDAALCIQCHNKESPGYKPFCLKEFMAKIEHLDPRKERSKEELEKLRATCYPDCPKCKKSEGGEGKGGEEGKTGESGKGGGDGGR